MDHEDYVLPIPKELDIVIWGSYFVWRSNLCYKALKQAELKVGDLMLQLLGIGGLGSFCNIHYAKAMGLNYCCNWYMTIKS
nr:hypothetical protein [Mycoplasmopsis bovis]